MQKKSERGTPADFIASSAMTWRNRDRIAIGDRGNSDKQRAEWAARQALRKTIDDARKS